MSVDLATEMGKLRDQIDRLFVGWEAAEAENIRLRTALAEYADPRHWGIGRNDYANPVCAWIGPGAVHRVPDGGQIARAALDAEAAAR